MSTYNLLNGYIGNKAAYVAKIEALFDPACTKYVEPFMGGGSAYFHHYNGKYEKEWINEINPNVVLLYKALEDDEIGEAVMQAILEIEKPDNEDFAREQFKKAKEGLMLPCARVEHLPKDKWVEKVRDIFIAYSQSFNCGAKSYSRQKSNEKYKWETRRNLLNAVERLKTHPIITQYDGIKVIEKVKSQKEVQIFCDWPYVGLYRNESNLYHSEMSGLYDHVIGALKLCDSQAAVVMCDYRSQYKDVPTIYDAILTGEEWHCFKLADTYKHCEVVEIGGKKCKAEEYVWTNRVPENSGLYLSLVDYKEKITMDEYWEKIRTACISKLVPDKHILEYEKTYKRLYDGKSLI